MESANEEARLDVKMGWLSWLSPVVDAGVRILDPKPANEGEDEYLQGRRDMEREWQEGESERRLHEMQECERARAEAEAHKHEEINAIPSIFGSDHEPADCSGSGYNSTYSYEPSPSTND